MTYHKVFTDSIEEADDARYWVFSKEVVERAILPEGFTPPSNWVEIAPGVWFSEGEAWQGVHYQGKPLLTESHFGCILNA